MLGINLDKSQIIIRNLYNKKKKIFYINNLISISSDGELIFF